MRSVRRLTWIALGLAYVHTVFGAIVRISGSGMGCGEHWPDCNGALVPVVTSYTVVVEVTHRYLAALLLGTTLALVAVSMLRRREPGMGGIGGVARPAILALGLIVTAALVGMLVVMLSLSNPYLIAVHYSIAMLTLAALVVAVQRAGGMGSADVAAPSISAAGHARTYRGARAAAVMAFVTVVMGALTANISGAAPSCRGFPWCRTGILVGGAPLAVQLTHRILAVLLFFHLCATAYVVTRREGDSPVARAAQLACAAVVLQVIVAALLVESRLPPPLQSLHQAVGTLLWVVVFSYAALARRAATRPALEIVPVAIPSEALA
jgi:heme A synthase